MKEPYYTIKEASERVGVESHVLRYWEEELKMEIHRNQMGHRYYTGHDIDLLCMIKELKDNGLQLKAIRNYIEKRKEQLESEKVVSKGDDESDNTDGSKTGLVSVDCNAGLMSNEEKLEQFQRIMNRILSNAIRDNNELIGQVAARRLAEVRDASTGRAFYCIIGLDAEVTSAIARSVAQDAAAHKYTTCRQEKTTASEEKK